MMPTPENMTKTPVIRPSARGIESPYPTVVIVTIAHQSASPPVVMFAPGDRLSNCRTRMLATERTIPPSRIVMNVAYWPRLCSTSATICFWFCPRKIFAIRVRRKMRKMRRRAANGRKVKLGIDPSRSIQPRWPTRYARLGRAPVRL